MKVQATESATTAPGIGTDPAWEIMSTIFSVLAQFNGGYRSAEPGQSGQSSGCGQPATVEPARH
jgi:hypothetical protein